MVADVRPCQLCAMCYGVKARTEMALNIARSRGDQPAVDRLQRLLQPKGVVEHWFANGFDHPELVLYTDGSPNEPRLLSWGLVPTWFKDLGELARFRKQTLNARGETMFDKPAFRSAAEQRRAILFVEGYYEHYHLGGRAYPFFIHLKGGAPFALAALWEEWVHPSGDALCTFSIVTTEANALMARIHNKPGPTGPRMPVVLGEREQEVWLSPVRGPGDRAALADLVKPWPADAMEAHAVRPLLGKNAWGDRAGASDPFEYPELLLGGPMG